MKTQRTISIKSLKNGLILAALIGVFSCDAQNKQQEKDDSSQTQESSVAAPDTDIHTAVITNDLDAIKQHIAAGTDINQKEPFGGSTPLISAIVFDKPEIAQALINAGADIEMENNEGSTALHSAAFFCRVEMVKALLKKGADKTKKNNTGATPIQTVSGPYDAVRPIYDFLGTQLAPMGYELDHEYLERTRPIVAELLK